MSATTELLTEQISDLETRIKSAQADQRPILEAELALLRRRLNGANEALNEGKQVLKG